MTKTMRISTLSNNLAIGAGTALVLAMTLMTGFQYAHAATYTENILVGNNMTVGETGGDVAVLQGLMSELGYLQLPMGVSEGYYGELTRSAVARYQASQGVAPSVGYFGPMTKIALHQEFFVNNWLTMLGW